ncbi:MAG TPA: thiamine phosphate synthase [Terriglobia bacterium]|nr:thiamine phosphate synthase [Terriglobia bacterium]
MKTMDCPFPRLYAIIDAAQTQGRSPQLLSQLLLDVGVKLIQYRDKQSSPREVYEVSRELARQAASQGGLLIVNDRADIALAAGAGGVHVGQDDLPPDLARKILGGGKLVGFSTHNLDQLKDADRQPVDYIAVGPIFTTRSKERADPVVGLELLRQARKLTRKRLVAIGGITLETAPAVIAAGADSVAVIHDLISADDPGQRANEYLKVLGGA